MSFTNFPNGVTSFGIPLLGGNPVSVPIGTQGTAWFVDATNGNNGNSGTDPGNAFKTITKAHAVATAGDTIYIQPGSYTENLVITKNYISLVGAQISGYGKPDIVPVSGIPLTVNAQGFAALKVRFAGTAADSVKQSGNGFLYSDCVFDGDGTAAKAGIRLVPAQVGADITHYTASEGFILNSLIRGCAIGIAFDTAAAPVGVGSTDNVIQGNRFYTNTLDIATAKTGAAGTYSVQLVTISYNQFEDKIKATYIDITTNEDGAAASQTGVINFNVFANDSAPMTTTQIKMVGTGFTFSGNFNTSGVVVGSALD
jgi:hypothetical protein